MTGYFDCLIGLNFGSEGKGKIASYLSRDYDVSVRTGGPNSGHTFYNGSEKHVVRHVPSAVLNRNLQLVISQGSVLNIDVLRDEIKRYALTPDVLKIDSSSAVVLKEHCDAEKKDSTLTSISSTLQGTGAAKSDKIMRRGNLAQNLFDGSLQPFLEDCSYICISHLENGKRILVEGAQGFGLSLNYGYYPYVTSQDVTVSSLISDSGLPVNFHRHTVGVLRTYPIRVGGTSGPLNSEEITWKDLTLRSGASSLIQEFSSVTKKLRRIFEQDYSMLNKAISVNRPDMIALTFLDYVNFEDYGKNEFMSLSKISNPYSNFFPNFPFKPVLKNIVPVSRSVFFS